MAAFSDFYRQVRLHCRSCPDITIDSALLLAAREFCRKTWALREIITITEVAGDKDYTLATAAPTQTDVLAVVYARREDERKNLAPVRIGTVDTTEEGTPRGWYFVPTSTFNLWPIPASTYTGDQLKDVAVTVAITPLATATQLPDELAYKYEKEIAFGAISYLCMMPGEAWTNERLAKDSEMRFNEAMRAAKSEAMFEHVPNRSMITMPVFNI